MKDLYKPSVQKSLLEDLKIFPKKSLSQHFLIDQNILKKITQAADLKKNDWVLEIGPGLGALTEVLCKAEAHVIAVEKDDILAKYLQKTILSDASNLEVVHENILSFDLPAFITQKKIQKKIKVIANLPYKLTSPILGYLLKYHSYFSSMTLMVQKEVAHRMCAKPKTKDFSSFSIFVQTYTHAKKMFDVHPGSFFPKPKVSSSVVYLEIKQSLPPIDIFENFSHFVRQAFSARRKMVKNTFLKKFSQELIEKVFARHGISLAARAEEIDVEQWLKLYESFFTKDL